MIKVNNIKCPIDIKLNKNIIAKKLRCSTNDILSFKILKESLDARKEDIFYMYQVALDIKNESRYLKQKDVEHYEITIEPILKANKPCKVAVIGFGPSGIFAALTLAKAGLNPVIFERGSMVDERTEAVETFWKTGKLNTECNVQFGEGGAGTFSDGKLTTRIKDKRVKEVLETLVKHGAKEEITYQALPHIGTDVLRHVIKNIRNEIIELGGTFHFDTCVTGFNFDQNHNITSIITPTQSYDFDEVILCIGHSAIDTFKTLYDSNVHMEQKDFAVGVRVEHPQELINRNQYNKHYLNPNLPVASYRLSYHSTNGRGVYSFCMCPGGVVVNSSSEYNTIVTNGMSYAARDKENANSAILVQVPASDYQSSHPLAGFDYQKEIEQKTFNLTKSNEAPVQNIKDFINNTLNECVIHPSFTTGYELCDLHSIFNDEINQSLTEAFIDFDHKINGFIDKGVMTASETRSSCPVRITRNDSFVSLTVNNLYPCGEGAGYAGGIVSSAVDGIKCAQALIKKINE